VGRVVSVEVSGGGLFVTPVGGGVFVGLEDGFADVGFKLEEAAGVADVMRVVGLDVDGGAFCLMSSCANEEAGRIMDRKRRLEENGRLDFVQRHARLERVFRRVSMFDNVYKKGM
jgi:hypothetical protein